MPKKAKKTNKGRNPLLLPSLLERLGKYAAGTKQTRSAALEKLPVLDCN